MFDNDRTLRFHYGTADAWVSFMKDGKPTEKVGWVSKPEENQA